MTVEGSLRVNGALVGDASAMAAMSGYVQQEDAFVPMLTVREHLWFNAMLRMDREVTDDERNMKIDQVLREVCGVDPLTVFHAGFGALLTVPCGAVAWRCTVQRTAQRLTVTTCGKGIFFWGGDGTAQSDALIKMWHRLYKKAELNRSYCHLGW